MHIKSRSVFGDFEYDRLEGWKKAALVATYKKTAQFIRILKPTFG